MSADPKPLGGTRPATLRLFFALWPGDAVAEKLGTIAREISGHHGGRPTRQETIHLTLAFLGNVPAQRLEELKQLASGIQGASFSLVLDRLGHWRHNHLAWAGMSKIPSGLLDLSASLMTDLERAGFSVDHGKRAFIPHVTLVRRIPDRQTLALPELAPLEWPCREFRLVLSRLSADRPVYDSLDIFPLGDPLENRLP